MGRDDKVVQCMGNRNRPYSPRRAESDAQNDARKHRMNNASEPLVEMQHSKDDGAQDNALPSGSVSFSSRGMR